MEGSALDTKPFPYSRGALLAVRRLHGRGLLAPYLSTSSALFVENDPDQAAEVFGGVVYGPPTKVIRTSTRISGGYALIPAGSLVPVSRTLLFTSTASILKVSDPLVREVL